MLLVLCPLGLAASSQRETNGQTEEPLQNNESNTSSPTNIKPTKTNADKLFRDLPACESRGTFGA